MSWGQKIRNEIKSVKKNTYEVNRVEQSYLNQSPCITSIRKPTMMNIRVPQRIGKLSTINAAIRFPVSGVLLTASLFVQAQAQESTAKTSTQVDSNGALATVVVTGTSEKKTKAQTSYSITSMDEQFLLLQGATSVTESLKSVPGFWVEASGGEGSGNVRARGVPVDGFGSVNILEDGLPVQHDPALGYLNGDQAFRIDDTYSRIEVVRGGPASLFYANAPAGAVNYITRSIGSKPAGSVKLSTSDHSQKRVDFWYTTPIADDAGLLIGGFYRRDNGVRDPGFTGNDGGQYRIRFEKEIDHGRASLDFKQMNDKVEFYLGLPMRSYADGSIAGVPGVDANYATIAGPQTALLNMRRANGGTYVFDNTEGTHVKRNQLTAQIEREIGDNWNVKDSLRISDTQTQRNYVQANAMYSISSFLAGSSSLLSWVPGAVGLDLRSVSNPNVSYVDNGLVLNGGARGITMPVQEVVNDLHLSKKFKFDDQEHRVDVGLYTANFNQGFSRYSSQVLLGAGNQAPLLNLVGLDASGKVLGNITDNGVYRYGYEWANATGQSSTQAIYLTDDWKVNSQLSIDGGLRWEQVNVKGQNERSATVNLGNFASSQMLTGTGVIDTYDQTFSKTGVSVGANYQFDKSSGIFARYSSAFRLPNLSNYITSPTPTYTPPVQTMDLAEVGYKFASDFVELYPTIFYTKYNNVAFTNYVFSPSGSSTPEYLYANTKTIGLELDGIVRFSPMLDLGFVVTTEDPLYDNFAYTTSSKQSINYSGNQLIRVPRTSYRLVPGINLFGDRLRIQASYEYVGSRFVDVANSVMLPDYRVTNLAARYNIDKSMTFLLNIDNLNNSMGLTEGNPRAGEVQSADAYANSFIARPIIGRNIRVSLKYDF